MKIRSSSCSPLFMGDDGLTEIQQAQLDELLLKIKLTSAQAIKRDYLQQKSNIIELSKGAKTLIEEYINREFYGYTESFSNPKTQKGWDVEQESIDIYNRIFFTNYHKQAEFDKYYHISYGISVGHPDIVDCDNKKIIDIKSSWSKKTFPKTIEQAYDPNYEWQVKHYLYIMGKMTGDDWRHGEVAFILTTTPEELKPDYEDDSLHYMEHLDDNLRATVFSVELTDKDIVKMDKRLATAEKYAIFYSNLLNNKNV